jgi:hypothetical protein
VQRQPDPTRLHSAAGDGHFESVDGGNTWRRVVDGLEHQYRWSIAISLADAKTLLLSTSKSAYGAHYKESANSIIYRLTGSDAWKPVRKGLPDPQGLRIPVVAASSSEPGVFYCSTEGGGLPVRGRRLAMAEARGSMEQQSYG